MHLLNRRAAARLYCSFQASFQSLANQARPARAIVLAILCTASAQLAFGQSSSRSEADNPFVATTADEAVTPTGPSRFNAKTDSSSLSYLAPSDETKPPARQASRPEADLIVEGLASYGHYKIFASGSDCKLYTAGIEYDRHSWGYFLKARADYVAEFLPVVLLHAPVTQDIWGTPTSPNHYILPGIGISPIGFRLLWRDKKAIKPYLEAKGGMLGFTHKALSQQGTYEDFSLQSATGLNVNVSDKWGLRLGLFSDFHFSDDFIVPVNPGLDVMNANFALVYHLGAARQ